MRKSFKIYLHGHDGIGWSIDKDRQHVKRFLLDMGHQITKNPFIADIIHSVWWNRLLDLKSLHLRLKKKIIATATNEIDPDSKEFIKARRFVTLWIAPNRKQYKTLEKTHVKVAYQPFYVDEKVFRKLNIDKQEIAERLGINFQLIKDKILIGSFQRDTLGKDLTSPKWQKGPDMLINILKSLPNKDRWLLFLAGPRRHYIINACEELGIPYYYYGVKPKAKVDDININILNTDTMVLLYNLIDCYIVSSRSESGPKAILEASFCKTLIFSTEVGMAPDILDKRCIYRHIDEIVALLTKFIEGKKQNYFREFMENNFYNAMLQCSYDATKARWEKIYESI